MASTTADLAAYYSRVLFITYWSIMPILFVMGIVGAILSGIIFSHKSMRKNPGSIYFIAQSVTIFMIMVSYVLLLSLRVVANVQLNNQSLAYCKLLIYSTGLCPALHRYCLVLAAIDRTLITSSNATVRNRSTHRLAYWTISGMTLIAILYYIHVLVGYDIYALSPGTIACAPSLGTYSYFYAYSNLVVNNLIPLSLLSILAIKTLRNLQRVRIQPTNTDSVAPNTHRSKDRQLTILLLADILILVFLQSLVTSLTMYINITRNQVKSPSQQLLELFLQNIATIFVATPPAISFYQNLLISKSFRRKAKEVLFGRFCQHQ
ncbi:unnamed protein product [Adineta steineri]|uniref:G-protein coupled receptors family 1 profile domain-containing protein n=1 Tax=Adineta steineri TaxID=433720 RepID=A0A819XYW5_9BILA|nr:unnamed protein product [Adineta steineri]